MRTISFLFLLLAASNLQAQKKDDHAKADKIYQKLGYAEAIELYRQGKLDLASMERMANGYRLNHDTYNAERWYAQVVGASDNPLNYLYYAQACHSNGNYLKAKEFYLKYNQRTGGGDKRGEQLAKALDRQAEFKNRKGIEVKNAAALNSDKLDFSPALFENGVVFASTRQPEGAMKKVTHEKDAWTGDDFSNLYFAKENGDGSLGKPEVFAADLGTRFHEGPLTFSRSGDQVFFTRNNVKKGGLTLLKQLAKGREELKLKIYAADRSGENWSSAKPLDLGETAANDAHPSLSPDGQKLYFASDRQGGLGGMDLYVSTFSNGNWSAPVNLGNQINTPGNELFPFIYDDGTLYFASDGWGGLGGLDIFFSEKIEENQWRSAANLGAPFNSPKDDFGYVLNFTGSEGYFTSARDGGAGKDDIYTFSLPEPQANKNGGDAGKRFFTICATDASTGERLSGVKINVLEQIPEGGYQGFEDDFVVKLVPTGVDGEFNLSLKRRDPFANQSTETETYVTDANGNFQIELDPAKQYLFVAKKGGYQDATETLTLANLENAGVNSPSGGGGVREFCIPLTGANCLSLNGKVLNKRYGNVIPNATVTLMNLCTGDLTHVKSDAQGNYHFACIPCNCDFIVQGSKANFKQDNNLASTVGMDCDAANEPLEKDLQLLPDPGASGTPDVASYKPDRNKLNEKPGWQNDAKGTGYQGHPDDTERPIEEFLEDPEAFDRVLEEGLTIELENIYYDFDKSDIRPDAAIELDKVVALMRRHPDLLVELRSHTDSRAEDGYNQALSQRRAVEALRYLMRSGISGSRIEVKGYGESWLVNECENGTPCPEPDHQMNRRTEIKVFRR